MNKIQMTTPLVEMDGDEMTRSVGKHKKLSLFISLILPFAMLCSCSDNEEFITANIQKEIVGKWKLVEWPGVNLDLNDISSYYEFKDDYKIEMYETSDRCTYQYTGTYSFNRGWEYAYGKHEGNLSIRIDEKDYAYRCILQKDTLIMIDKESQSYEEGIPFLSPLRKFKKTE